MTDWQFAGLYQGQIENDQGSPMVNTSVGVFLTDSLGAPTTTLANLYTDRTKLTPAVNPGTSDRLGNFSFYADPGLYAISASGTEIVVAIVPDSATIDSGGGVTQSSAYVIGPADGLVADSGVTDNTSVLEAHFTAAAALGYGNVGVLPAPGGGYYGCDFDIPANMGLHGFGPWQLKNPGKSIPPTTGFTGTTFGPVIGAVGVAPVRCTGESNVVDNCCFLGNGPGTLSGTFPTGTWNPVSNSAPATPYALYIGMEGARINNVFCFGGLVSGLGFSPVGTETIDCDLSHVTCVNQIAPVGYSQLAPRTDTATWTAGTSTIVDSTIATTDQGSAVSGITGISKAAFVGPVVASTSFTVVDCTGTPITTTTGSGASISVYRYRGMGFWEQGADHMLTNLRVLGGGVYSEGADPSYVHGHFSYAGQTSNVVVNSSQGTLFSACIFDCGTNTPTSLLEVRNGQTLVADCRYIQNTSGSASVTAIVDKRTNANQGGISVIGGLVPKVTSTTGLLYFMDCSSGIPANNKIIGVLSDLAQVTTWVHGGPVAIFENNTATGSIVFQDGNPSISAGAGAGSGATAAYVSGHDTCAVVQVTSGSGSLAAGTQAAVTFSTPLAVTPTGVLICGTGGGGGRAAGDTTAGSITSSGFNIVSAALGATSTTYNYLYKVVY